MTSAPPPARPGPSPLLPVIATLAAIVAVFAILSTRADFWGEGGPVEISSIVAYLGAAVTFLIAVPPRLVRANWQIPATFALAAARELDLDKALLSGGILKSRFYLSDAPLWERAVGLAIVAFVLSVAIRLIARGWRPVMAGLRQGRAWAILTVGAIVALVAAKSMDGAGRKLADFGIEITETLNTTLGQVEEVLELGAALAVLVAIAVWARDRRLSGIDAAG